jgi:hypothetical protein
MVVFFMLLMATLFFFFFFGEIKKIYRIKREESRALAT